MLTSEMAVLKSRHGISVKCSPYRDTGTTDPSLLYTIKHLTILGRFVFVSKNIFLISESPVTEKKGKK